MNVIEQRFVLSPLGSFAEDMRRSMSVSPAYRPGGGGGESA